MRRKKPELLIPASSLEVLKVAVIFGADAVYIGGEAYGLRAKAKNFSMEDMKEGTGLKAFSGTDVDIYVYSNNDLKTLSQFIAPNIFVFRSIFEELSAYEGELDYTDGEVTDLEIKYAEYKAVAEMMRSVDYIGGQSLYDFCLNYVLDTSDYSSIHPLAVALNEGQIAMTKLAHYYDVVRYSMSEYPEESIDEDITRLEERYIDNPFEIYMGVDRSLFDDTFALTTNAYRANAYDESNALGECLFGGINIAGATTQLNMGRIGTRFSVWSIVKAGDNGSSNMADGLSQKAVEKLDELTLKALEDIENTVLEGSVTYGEYIDHAYARMEQELGEDLMGDIKDAWNSSPHIIDKAMALVNAIYSYKLPTADVFDVGYMQGVGTSLFFVAWEKLTADPAVSIIKTLGTGAFDIGMYAWGTISSIRSAIALYDKIHDHYHPKYDEIPMVMVDGKLYLDTGMESNVEARCGVMDGEITSSVDGTKKPTKDGESNFGTGYGYQYGPQEGTIEIFMNEKWWVFATEDVRQEIQFPTDNVE